MEKALIKKIFSVGITLALIAAIALFGSACGNTENAGESSAPAAVSAAAKEVGSGKTKFSFTVEDGKTVKEFSVKTDKKTVGEALSEVGLIKGEEGPYGLSVSTVDGVTYDFDKDKKYWAFYENGQYAAKGVDQTEVKAGASYAFKSENG